MQAYWFVHYCISMAKYIINKGIHAYIRVHGLGLIVGEEYTACLYYSPKKEEFRISAKSVAEEVDNEPVCVFTFTPEQTSLLKNGNCVLEVFDSSYRQMKFDEEFAEVRPTSLSE